ncbi:MAG: hypothetical protein V8Q85_02665 [Christensenellales bacterium]
MKRVCEMNQSELNEFYAAAKKEYEACKAKGSFAQHGARQAQRGAAGAVQ